MTTTSTTSTPPTLSKPRWVPLQWQLRLQDSLQSNECETWICGPDDTGTNRTFSSEGYELSTPANGSIQGTNNKPANTFSNFYYQATVIIKSGTNDSGDVGLVFRLDDKDSDYIFDFDSSGDWELSYYNTPTDKEKLLGQGTSTTFNQGTKASNVLGVLAVANAFTLYVNGNELATVTDPNHRVSGKQIGFEVDAGTSVSADAVFSDVEVWAL